MHLHGLGQQAVEGRGDDIGQQGKGEEQHQQGGHAEQQPEQPFSPLQPVGQLGHDAVQQGLELAGAEPDQAGEQHQIDGQRNGHEAPQPRLHDEFLAAQ